MMANNRIRYDVVTLLVFIVLLLNGMLTVGEAFVRVRQTDRGTGGRAACGW